MKPLFTCIFLIFVLNSFAQSPAKPVNIILSGKVKSYESGEKPYIYYAIVGKKFTLRNRLKMDSTGSYVFDLSKTAYKNATTGVMVFSLDSTYNMKDEYSCVHRINLGEINKYAKGKGLKSIKLASDLVMDFYCETYISSFEAKGDEVNFVGKYKQEFNKTTSNIELRQGGYTCKTSSTQLDKDLMNAGFGRWELKDNGATITVSTWYKINKEFGTMLATSEQKSYKVANENGAIVLASAGEKSYYGNVK